MNTNLIEADIGDYEINKKWSETTCLYKPIWYYNKTEDISLTHRGRNWGRSYKGYNYVNSRLVSTELTLKEVYCRPNKQYIVGGGMLFIKENNAYTSLFITCLGEKTTYLINNRVNTIPQIKKIVANICKSTTGVDVIYSDNIDSFCFNNEIRVNFRSFTEQRSYYQYLADSWLQSEKEKLKGVKKEQLELAI